MAVVKSPESSLVTAWSDDVPGLLGRVADGCREAGRADLEGHAGRK